ncbi:hypothetical protein GUJ93_ZPchr0001g31608 [Zizania palustris]|uniref:Uncharacterized protein n=1 Tax=Zizania palustris TaxID=103762 RepID=A0A8J5RY55_ZIZPA|nr:hypothetical protein GUJ93_ZPchr0001g31608 [Zizania palustris]
MGLGDFDMSTAARCSCGVAGWTLRGRGDEMRGAFGRISPSFCFCCSVDARDDGCGGRPARGEEERVRWRCGAAGTDAGQRNGLLVQLRLRSTLCASS